jgi:Pyruvate/2-oxoacid:ferredoxin oxidoreductase gamma subunit
MVMLGALVQKSGVFPVKALENALKDLIKSKALKLDIDAIRAGTEFV